MTDFFARNMTAVYFFYGLSFFSMGLGILIEMGHFTELEFARALRPLAGFGLVHGGHEWLEMFLIISPLTAQGSLGSWINLLRLVLLSSSFLLLILFGARLIAGQMRSPVLFTGIIRWLAFGAILVAWLAGLIWVIGSQPDSQAQMLAGDVYTRYALGIPGAALSVWGLLLQRRQFIEMGMAGFGNDVAMAALAFGLYGGIGQLFTTASQVFPSGYLNAEAFMRWFGFPIQVFRASMGAIAAVFIIRSLRAFEVENRRRLKALNEAQQAEHQRLEALHSELLHRTVKAQESERQRIARELHDETGQTLTALGMGLRGLSGTILENPQRAAQQAKQLEGLAVDGVEELQHMIGGLHPPQLDDLGLLAALRWYVNEIKARYNLAVQIISQGPTIDLPAEVRTVFFRVAQEALTNIVRHSAATHVEIFLRASAQHIYMEVKDDGQGFDVQQTMKATGGRPCWGLLGMRERAALVGGECRIESKPGAGTRVILDLPLEMDRDG